MKNYRIYEWGQLTLEKVLDNERGYIFVETPREGRERPLLFSAMFEAVSYAVARGLVLGLEMSKRPRPVTEVATRQVVEAYQVAFPRRKVAEA
jgi:hypothetical protein